ncbi:GNAT family N-acetyltransferase [Xanthovirga aplysinae]|uniref:GNAT family N-acetyltransferase n=1 Tax=Xanthovirga aplysinae TaxID=2529853 RepID=UPI0012BB5164|nr:GNAT family N-acetyltransferase [Xanthovirga aplysinae]MTI30635.1 N-acetyltransferase [Xanthovirga aplysinae]
MDLFTSRLKISPIIESDIPDIHKMNSFEEVAEFNTIGIPVNIEETKKILTPLIEENSSNNKTNFGWTVRIKTSNEFIGEIGMHLAPHKFKMAEIHYSLLPKHWGNGYAIESVRRIINFGFDHLQLHRIEAGVATENTNSIKLLEKIGMKREGMKRKILPIREEWKDNYHYAILENDKRDY